MPAIRGAKPSDAGEVPEICICTEAVKFPPRRAFALLCPDCRPLGRHLRSIRLSPSVRGPVGVNTVLFSYPWIPNLVTEPPLSPSFHPQSLLSDGRSLPGRRPSFSRCCDLIIDLGSRLATGVGPGIGRSHLISAVELGC